MTTTGYPQAGETIGHYRVGRRIGSGGMGVVFEAFDENLQRAVALKVIADELAADDAFRARFTSEAQAQASLDSPHVVQVFAHGEDEGRLWIASQLVPDGDLRTVLATHGAPPPAIALDVIGQVAAGLAAAHAAGLVHRDIKPANVLLRRRDGSFHAYLADFGIARPLDAEPTRTVSAATVGTPTYMAPELHTGGTPGVASDIYSLGCLLWACLSGKAPYDGTSDFEIVTAHRERPVPQLPGSDQVATGLNALLRATMAKDPASRPASAELVRAELARLRGLVRTTAAPPSAPPPPPVVATGSEPPVAAGLEPERERPGRGLALALALVAVVVVVAAVLGWAATRGDDDPERASAATSPSVTASESGPSPTGSAESSATPSTPSPSAPTGSGTYSPAQVEAAVSAMAAAFATQPGVTEEAARCVAERVIAEIGLERLVEIGMFDEELAFVDQDLADHPEVKAALTTATFGCVAGG